MSGSIISHVSSADGVRISYERTGSAPTALVFVHGWLGSSRWWDAQREAFSHRFTVVQIDLAGHGASGRGRATHSAEAYANDLTSAMNALDAERIADRSVLRIEADEAGIANWADGWRRIHAEREAEEPARRSRATP